MLRVAVDGPAGAGKSTISKSVAQKQGLIYIDTGAMYRAVALYMIRNGFRSVEAIEAALCDISIEIKHSSDAQLIFLNGEDVTGLIRTEEVSKGASAVAVIPAVRLKLVELQQRIAAGANVIMDGRDIGTYVLPDAELKIYLTASAKARAKRRYDELLEKGVDCSFDDIYRDIVARDENDMNRDFAPLRQAEDAVLVDTTDDTLEEAIEKIMTLVEAKKAEVS